MILHLLRSAYRPREIQAMFLMKSQLSEKHQHLQGSLDDQAALLNDRDFCYAVLNRVSRSFAFVIRQLPGQVKDAVCIFYLVLRALDTIEDDMSLDPMEKERMLRDFHMDFQRTNWRLNGIGDQEDYRALLAHFPKVSRAFHRLAPGYRDVITEVAAEMAEGMREFAERPVLSRADYDKYCHYVAGLVGIGLSRIFAVSGLESVEVGYRTELSNSMGCFLQKTNIIRDYQEDLPLGRIFWPEEIWREYASEIGHFQANPKAPESMDALNHMVRNALQHVPDCIEYLAGLKDERIFRFCAIPQVMAISTLALVFNNPKSLQKPVKIRKGKAAHFAVFLHDQEQCLNIFRQQAASIRRQMKNSGITDLALEIQLDRIEDACRSGQQQLSPA